MINVCKLITVVLANAVDATEVIELGRVIEVSACVPEKQLDPIVLTPSGIVIELSLIHL